MTEGPRLTEEQARRLWQRAAELQAEAARTLEERSEGLARREAGADVDDDGSGYSLAHVRQAALEAGISPEFVQLAVQETRAGRLGPAAAGAFADRVMGEGPTWLESTRIYDHSAATLFESMQRVFPRLRLDLVDAQVGEPSEGGTMQFELPTVGYAETAVMKNLYHWADVRELHVRLVPLGEDRCEVSVRAPLGWSRRMGAWVSAALSLLGGGVVGLIAGGIGAAVVDGMTLSALAELLAVWGPAAAGFGAGTWSSLRGFRALSRLGWGKGQSGLDRLLASLATDIQTRGAFQPAPAPPSAIQIPGLSEG